MISGNGAWDMQVPHQLQWQPKGTKPRRRVKTTLRQKYDRARHAIHISVIPEWEDINATAHLKDDWKLFIDTTCASGGGGRARV